MFIELHVDNQRFYINLNMIELIQDDAAGCTIWLPDGNTLKVDEPYDNLQEIIYYKCIHNK